MLGVVGAVLGSAFGVVITIYINEIEQFLTRFTGHELFDRSVYYFNEIPTDLNVGSVLLINVGAVAIAVLFSVCRRCVRPCCIRCGRCGMSNCQLTTESQRTQRKHGKEKNINKIDIW